MLIINSNKAVTSREGFERYKSLSKNISKIEGVFEIGVQGIRNMVKRNIDISSEVDIAVIAISSLNRINYTFSKD